MSKPEEFEDDLIDDDLEDDWEALMAKEEAEEEAKREAEEKAALAALNKGPRVPKYLKKKQENGEEIEVEVDDEEFYANESEEDRRARIELQRQIEASQDTAGIFGGSAEADKIPEISDMPPLSTWEKAKTRQDLDKAKDRVLEVVSRFHSNPNFAACVVPCFTTLFKGLDEQTLTALRTYLDTCKDPIEVRRQQKKAQRKAEEEAKAKANETRATQRVREGADLFGGVVDRAGVVEQDDGNDFM